MPDTSAAQSEQLLRKFSFKRLLLPLSIGIIATAAIVYFQFDIEALKRVDWSVKILLWLVLGVVLFVASNWLLFYRYRLYTDNQLSWKRATVLGLMLMFAHSVFPPLLAATAIQYLLLRKEGISYGKSASVFFMVSFMDHVVFALGIPILIFFLTDAAGNLNLGLSGDAMQYGVAGGLVVSYTIVLGSLTFYACGLFISPHYMRPFFTKLFSTRLLKRWKPGMEKTLDELVLANQDIKQYGALFWLKNIAATLGAWGLRFAVVNCVIAAFSFSVDHFIVFAKQFPIQILMMNVPTPGGVGTAEIMFAQMLSVHVPTGLSGLLALLWRIITYYPYIIIGVFLLPIWVREKYLQER